MKPKRLKYPIMFVGTGSDVGKSVLVAGFCRILLQDGYAPAPFKSQNMSLNSFVTPEGGELGRAQAVQAEACNISCHTDMNPVLLKPSTDTASQVILNGVVAGNYSAKEYFKNERKQELFQQALEAFERLSSRYNPIVIEGAGSISELNLKNRDIANMKVAVATQAHTILIADIDRGGVFASIYGSIMLLEPEERKQIKGIIINKFRGDKTLFDEGCDILFKITGVPVLGVIPFYKDIHIEDEDSVALEKKYQTIQKEKINIAVIKLPRISNFTDFNRLALDERVNLFFTTERKALEEANIIIIPGSKNTIEDLQFLKMHDLDDVVYKMFKSGKSVVGICGGYQMLGKYIADPSGVEGNNCEISGLGILPISTILEREKTTRQTTFQYKNTEGVCKGYEIHMGRTVVLEANKPLNTLDDGTTEGYQLHTGCWGSYMHGILDNAQVIEDLLAPFSCEKKQSISYQEFKEQQYDKLAQLIRENCDMELFYELIQK